MKALDTWMWNHREQSQDLSHFQCAAPLEAYTAAMCVFVSEGLNFNAVLFHQMNANLYAQFARHISKWLQLFSVFADALQVVLAELVLGVDQREDPLHQSGPEVWQNLRQAYTAPCGQKSECEKLC